MPSETGFPDLVAQVRRFVSMRGWGQFDRPKNLILAICGEAGELAAELQWLTDEESERARVAGSLRDSVADEMADVFVYLIRLADALGIDLIQVAVAKMTRNEERFPIPKGD
jgi:NTP pyrophosphatase (non-canonical NTP hydrolase)